MTSMQHQYWSQVRKSLERGQTHQALATLFEEVQANQRRRPLGDVERENIRHAFSQRSSRTADLPKNPMLLAILIPLAIAIVALMGFSVKLFIDQVSQASQHIAGQPGPHGQQDPVGLALHRENENLTHEISRLRNENARLQEKNEQLETERRNMDNTPPSPAEILTAVAARDSVIATEFSGFAKVNEQWIWFNYHDPIQKGASAYQAVNRITYREPGYAIRSEPKLEDQYIVNTTKGKFNFSISDLEIIPDKKFIFSKITNSTHDPFNNRWVFFGKYTNDKFKLNCEPTLNASSSQSLLFKTSPNQ
ncbi:hypothetical protein SCOR_05390 [Sulfidibacter corallicola]|uniref:Uncharacterized protein n=1 Tax=Sulfidibacter corallicola TaxID=2818388 RepID=A0A8A4TRU6_SULCO|nr:bZIP transcription factor [Sulfidibacter corallicola]QTD51792.1 hypothetical protein J3U87_04920 [Sulfidibacter corallicola]